MYKLISARMLFFTMVFILAQVMSNYALASQVDPTKPFGHKASSALTSNDKKMVLESIIHGNGTNTAIISGKVLKILDYIGEYQVMTINKQSVVLRSKTERIKLTIFKRNIVKASAAK